ncbi:unnamed protein product [Calypogeia fissa]
MGQGASSSDTHTAQPTKTTIPVNQLNESVFELHKPKGQRNMVVLFFHGFQHGNYENAHLSTWTTEDGSSTWLQTWLVGDDKYPDAHILSVGYNASLLKSGNGGSFDLYIIGENIVSDLLEATVGVERRCPIILVGHSFGGLVVKEVCSQVHKRASMGSVKHKTFLENINGVFFYSTPHRGISREISEHFLSRTNQQLLKYVEILSTSAARLHEDFERLQKQCSWKTAGVGEGSPTELSTYNKQLIVAEGSSRYGDAFVIAAKADHISVCRPMSKTSTSFNCLSNFLHETSYTTKRRVRPQNHQSLPKSRIGIDNVMEEVKEKLQKVTSLGLAGMGGIGKSTVAKELFNDMEHLYEYTCFVGGVKNRVKNVEDVVLDCMHYMGKRLAEKDRELEMLEGNRLLLVLDDVALEQHIGILSTLIDEIHVHEDSRFVVTSRDSELLTRCLDEVHPMPYLSVEFAKKLFLLHAFRQEVPPSFEKYVDIVVKKCGGLPLTLEVIGKHLYKKSGAIWKEAIIILDNAETVLGFDEKLWRKLRISYDGLDVEGRDMFLDCATIFYDESLDVAKMAWSITKNGLQETWWQRLVDLSLVWEVELGPGLLFCRMHEQLLSLGRKIATSSHRTNDPKNAFVWLSAPNRSEGDLKALVAIRLRGGSAELRYDEDEGFAPTTSVEHSSGIVHWGVTCDKCSMDPIQGPRFKSSVKDNYDLCLGCFEESGSRKEEYYCVNKNVDIMDGRTLCKMQRLRYLKMNELAIDQSHGATLPSTVVYLDMYDVNFSVFPFSPSNHGRMAVLKIRKCAGLRTLPATFGQLLCLQLLKISGAPNLKSLPDSLGSLKKLRSLKLKDCPTLEELPKTVGQLVSLENLTIKGLCLKGLPDSLGSLKNLRCLQLWECRSLAELPKTLGQLVSLEELSIRGPCLKSLPDSLGSLKKLRCLLLWYCRSLAELPKTLGQLLSLEHLLIQDCDALSALPESFGYLPCLKALCIKRCRSLCDLPDTFLHLQTLERLTLERTFLHSVPIRDNFRSLISFNVDPSDHIQVLSVSDWLRRNVVHKTQHVVEEENCHEEIGAPSDK